MSFPYGGIWGVEADSSDEVKIKMAWFKKKTVEEKAQNIIENHSGKYYRQVSGVLGTEILDKLYELGWELIAYGSTDHFNDDYIFKKRDRNKRE